MYARSARISRYRIRRTNDHGTVAVVRTISIAMSSFCRPVTLRRLPASALGEKAGPRSLLSFRPLHLSSTPSQYDFLAFKPDFVLSTT